MATALTSGRKVVTTAGTAVQITGTPARISAITITAETDNTGVVVFGDSSVVAALATRTGTPLNAGDTATVPVDSFNDIWLDSTVNGDGVTYNAVSGT